MAALPIDNQAQNRIEERARALEAKLAEEKAGPISDDAGELVTPIEVDPADSVRFGDREEIQQLADLIRPELEGIDLAHLYQRAGVGPDITAADVEAHEANSYDVETLIREVIRLERTEKALRQAFHDEADGIARAINAWEKREAELVEALRAQSEDARYLIDQANFRTQAAIDKGAETTRQREDLEQGLNMAATRIAALETQLANLNKAELWEITHGNNARIWAAGVSIEEAIAKVKAAHPEYTIIGARAAPAVKIVF